MYNTFLLNLQQMFLLKNLLQQGVIEYDVDGNFRPAESATRAEFADVVCNVMKYSTSNVSNSFADVDKSHKYYKEVSAVYENGHMGGDGTSFRPDDKLTCEEAAIVFVRMLYGSDADISNAKEKCAEHKIFDFIADGAYNSSAEVKRDEMAYMINKVLVAIYE